MNSNIIKEMIYQYKTHSINVETFFNVETFSLEIDFLEIIVDYNSRELLYVGGYFPLIKVQKSMIQLPVSKENSFYLKNINSAVEKFSIYSLTNKIPECGMYFGDHSITFDKKRGIILLGCTEKQDTEFAKINKNIIVGYDANSVLKCIYIMPDRFI